MAGGWTKLENSFTQSRPSSHRTQKPMDPYYHLNHIKKVIIFAIQFSTTAALSVHLSFTSWSHFSSYSFRKASLCSCRMRRCVPRGMPSDRSGNVLGRSWQVFSPEFDPTRCFPSHGGTPNSWMVYTEKAIYKLMITRATPIKGKPSNG